jgi:HEAT repeat protein
MTVDPDPAALVSSFANAALRVATLSRLQQLGDAALPAVRDGLKHPDWHIRHWCAIYLDRGADPETLRDLVPLLTDPEPRVRLWAIHSISCEHCKEYGCPIDVVPLLIERAERDPVKRVRKMAIAMLASLPRDARIPPVFERALAVEPDAKVRLHATLGLQKYSAA